MDKQNSMPLVSIIIPAFNAEKYINQCVNSVINQSYENIEIIVVNDGSTDNTQEKISDINDNRIKLINKENTGVSDSRNVGLVNATGDYVTFIDSDDWIASDYIEYMLHLVKQTKADFCMSQNCYTQIGEKQIDDDKIVKISGEDAAALLLSPRIIVGCWNKIYKRDFIERFNMKFSTTLFYGEGLSFITQGAKNAEFVGIGERKVYYYRRNNESSATTKFDIEKLRNGEKALKIIKKALGDNSDQINDMWILHMCLFSLGAIVRIEANGKKREYNKEYNHWKRFLRKNIFRVLKNKKVSLYRKLMLIGGCLSPYIMMRLDRIRRKNISAHSV